MMQAAMGRQNLLGLVLAMAPCAWAQGRADAPLTYEVTTEACRDSLEPILEVPRRPVATGLSIPKRLFGVIPNYRADQIRSTYTPLTRKQKFAIAHSDSFDWPNYFLLAGYAVQAQMAEKGFGQNGGIGGFGKYYARAVGDQIIGSYLTEAILPAWLHEDPRFFRKGEGPVWRRAYYAASRIFIAQKDDGGKRFNVSELAGNAAVVALTSAYYPDSRAVPEAAERFAMQLGNDVVSNLLTEFWPDIRRHLPFHKQIH